RTISAGSPPRHTATRSPRESSAALLHRSRRRSAPVGRPGRKAAHARRTRWRPTSRSLRSCRWRSSSSGTSGRGPRTAPADLAPKRSRSGEGALHAAGRMARHGALVGVLALLDRHGERRALAVAEHRRLLAGDLEIVLKLAGVGHLERDLAVLRF